MTRLRPFILVSVALAALAWTVAPAGAQQPRPVTTGPVGFNPHVTYGYDNFAYSPNIRKFVDSLPGLGLPGCSTSIPAGSPGSCNQNDLGQYIPVADNRQNTLYPDADYYQIGVKQYSLKMHADLPATTLRGYYQLFGSGPGMSTDPAIGGVNQYLGPLIIGRSFNPAKPFKSGGNGAAVRILFQNNLPTGTAGNLYLPVDPTLMGAGMGPNGTANYTQNRANLHLHGGNTPWISDGTPHQWITPARESFPGAITLAPYQKGASFQNVPDMVSGGMYKGTTVPVSSGDGIGTYYWTNQQSQRLMFYHDHSYGITRLNVYGGMAAGYLLTDQAEDNLISNGVIPDQADLGPAYKYGIPLVIQDKSFVNDASTPVPAGVTTPTSPTLATDPLWNTYVGTSGGNLWFPHEYMPNENIFDASGALPWGRWDYGPWLNPATIPITYILPSPSHVPETFADTMVVNGTAYPYLNLQPKAYRFRILNAGNDRVLNLQLYVAASKNFPATPGTTGAVLCDGTTGVPLQDCTEVKMVPAGDGRNGGIPDPLTAGPPMIQIGNEGGILPEAVTIPAKPINYEYSRRVPVMLNVTDQALLLMPAERADVIVDFSNYGGKSLVLYNDAPAPMPLFDERNDFYTGSPDWTAIGGAPSIPAGYGPNTRTVMQINICSPGAPGCGSAQAFDPTPLQTAIPQAYAATQAQPIVKQSAYNKAFGTQNGDTYVQNVDETVNLTGTGQGVSSVRVALPGSGYLTPPTVSFIPIDGNGSGASATACLSGVTGVTVTVAGAGYTTAPGITFTNPVGVAGAGVAAVATVTGGGVGAIAVTDPGCGYNGNPTITIAAPPCTINTTTCIQATATANVTLGGIGRIAVNTNGGGYMKAPFVFLTPVPGDPGRGATADALLAGGTVIGMKNITEGFEPWYGRMNVQLGTTPVPLDPFSPTPQVPGIAMYIDPPSDYMNDGQVQVFRIAHLGVDSHIVHFHLANLQVVNRVDFTNTMFPPLPNELGWKESIRTNPFTDLVVAVRPVSQWLPFQIPQSIRLMDVTTPAGSTMNYIQPAPVPGLPNPAGISNVMTNYGWEYVWHCHLLGHEENDMMRPIVFNVPSPPAPTQLTATAGSGGAQLSWNPGANTNARTYRIQRSTTQNFNGATSSLINGFPPPAAFTDTNFTSGGAYRYRVRAENGSGNSAWSNTATITVIALTAPSNLAATLQAGPAVRLTWRDNSNNETGFQISRNSAVVTTLPANSTSYTDSGVTLGNAYTYTVAAVNPNALNSPAYSNAASVSVDVPAAPTNVSATGARRNGNNDTITVTWADASTGESGFRIRYATNSALNGAATATVGANVTTYTTGNVPRNTTYYIQVQSYNALGASAWTPVTPVSVLTPP